MNLRHVTWLLGLCALGGTALRQRRGVCRGVNSLCQNCVCEAQHLHPSSPPPSPWTRWCIYRHIYLLKTTPLLPAHSSISSLIYSCASERSSFNTETSQLFFSWGETQLQAQTHKHTQVNIRGHTLTSIHASTSIWTHVYIWTRRLQHQMLVHSHRTIAPWLSIQQIHFIASCLCLKLRLCPGTTACKWFQALRESELVTCTRHLFALLSGSDAISFRRVL